MKRFRKALKILGLLVLAAALLWRAKLQFVPAGAEPIPFLFASTAAESITSPSGQKVSYRFNDGGAAQSGFHHTWCYTSHWLTGKKVIASGYSLPAVRKGEEEFPWYWHEEGGDFSVRFTTGRHDETILWYSGRVP
jgi:hypothetical protein